MIYKQKNTNNQVSVLNFIMAGDERIELPTVVLEDMKTPVVKS